MGNITDINKAIEVLTWLKEGKEVEQLDNTNHWTFSRGWHPLMWSDKLSFPQIQSNKQYRLKPPPVEYYACVDDNGLVIGIWSSALNAQNFANIGGRKVYHLREVV